MTDELLAKAATTLRDHADRIDLDSSRDVRARTVSAMEAALRAKSAKKQLRTRAIRFGLAATFVISAVGAYQMFARTRQAPIAQPEVTATIKSPGGGASTWHNGQPVPSEGKLSNGDRVTTSAASGAEIALSTGTSVVLGPSTDATITSVSKLQSFSLAGGKVAARVAKLQEGDRFLVRTADAEVEVRGTVFEVALVDPDPSCGGGTRTRVTVTEGVVVVRSQGAETRVVAGAKWPEGCVAPAVVVAPEPAPVAIAPPPAPHAPAVVTPAVSAAPTGDPLATKNDLFAAALAAKRRGELQTALAGFETYLAKYPGGELAESASAQRMSILAKLDPARAVAAAKDYLAKWPNGFAREEAEALSK